MEIARPRDGSELRQALSVLVARDDTSTAEQNAAIDTLLRYVDRNNLSLDHCLAAWRGRRMITSCLCMDVPGRVSNVFLPNQADRRDLSKILPELLRISADEARQRNVQLLQATVAPSAPHEARLLESAGFNRLATLIYMETDLNQPLLTDKESPKLRWVTYGFHTHALFAEVVQATYEQSLDCGSLNGLRDIEDILASHRGTGRFDPTAWKVGLVDDSAVGVILLADIPERFSYDVVYMGVTLPWRRRGYGWALLAEGVRYARNEAAGSLTLSVDERNTPARRLYARFGFKTSFQREVWIRLL